MSKASEWAFRAADLIRKEALLRDQWDHKPRFRIPLRGGGFYVPGEVTAEGRLLTASAMLTPRQALEFAKWILDTFGDDQ